MKRVISEVFPTETKENNNTLGNLSLTCSVIFSWIYLFTLLFLYYSFRFSFLSHLSIFILLLSVIFIYSIFLALFFWVLISYLLILFTFFSFCYWVLVSLI